MNMLEEKEYIDFHPTVLQKTSMVFDVDSFYECMEKYKYAFRTWGEEKAHLPRYGLPLVNQNGSMLNNPEPICYPLDEWIRDRPEKFFLDADATVSTEVLDESAFAVLKPIKKHMVRSAILRWDAESFFWPHTDTWMPSPILRLWGTTEPDKVKIQFDKQRRRSNPRDVKSMNPQVEDFEDFEIEAGRLYVIHTNIIHGARSCVDKETYQFFIAIHVDGIEDLQQCIIT